MKMESDTSKVVFMVPIIISLEFSTNINIQHPSGSGECQYLAFTPIEFQAIAFAPCFPSRVSTPMGTLRHRVGYRRAHSLGFTVVT